MTTAIIGLGKMGRFYDNLVSADYIVDIVPIANRVFFSSVDEFIAYGAKVDLVIVATTTPTHFEIVKKILHAGYNVLCEKPLCLSSMQAQELEKMAKKQHLILYQSTLERYNPVVKFIQKNVLFSTVKNISSHRSGPKPKQAKNTDALFDLGIHDLDLWFYLTKGKINWDLRAEYSDKQIRQIEITFNDMSLLKADLLDKTISFKNYVYDFKKSNQNNQMLEMLYDIQYKKEAMNELWSREIKIIENHTEKNIVRCRPNMI